MLDCFAGISCGGLLGYLLREKSEVKDEGGEAPKIGEGQGCCGMYILYV